jgi:hypothetical protein
MNRNLEPFTFGSLSGAKRLYIKTGLLLTGLVGFSLGLASLSNWILSSYFKFDIPGSLMYRGDDGWCRPETEGIGVHCFGDFNERLSPSEFDEWTVYPNNLETTPIGPFVTSIANLVATASNPRLVLILFYFLSVGLLIYPLYSATKTWYWPNRFLAIGLFGFASYPTLVILDRLNYLIFAVPILYILFKKMLVGNIDTYLIPILLLTAIKPQFGILSLIYFFRKKYILFIKVVCLQVITLFFLVVGAGLGDLRRIYEYVRILGGYGAFIWDVTTMNPPNASFTKIIYLSISEINELLQINADLGSEINNLIFTLVGGIVMLVFLYILKLRASNLSDLEISICLTVIGLLGFGNYVSAYYLIFVIPVVAIFLFQSQVFLDSKGSLESGINMGLDKAGGSWAIAIALSSTCLVLPPISNGFTALPNTNVLPTVGPTLATLFWFTYILKVIRQPKTEGR